MKRLQSTLCLAVIALSAVTVVLTVLGSIRYFDSFGIPYDAKGHATLLVRLLAGSAVTLPVAVVMLILCLREMQIPRWFVVIGALSAVFSFNLPQGIGHDFSHAVFEECSNKYGEVIFWLCATQALLLPIAYLINHITTHSLEAGPAA
jgi:hypothetical protein